jgi:hypothetical protein
MQLLSICLAPVTLSLVLLVVIQLDGHEKSAGTGDAFAAAWKQPRRLQDRFPEPISRSRWRLDFESAEEVLGQLRFTSDNEIAVDEATVILMTRLYDWQRAPENRDIDPARVRFLISRFFPDGACDRSFSDLFARFTAFKDARNRLDRSSRADEHSPPRNLADEEAFRLQRQFFSESEIEGLFGRQNRLTRYLGSRSRIIDDENLSPAQRRRAIAELGFDLDIDPDRASENGPCR